MPRINVCASGRDRQVEGGGASVTSGEVASVGSHWSTSLPPGWAHLVVEGSPLGLAGWL